MTMFDCNRIGQSYGFELEVFSENVAESIDAERVDSNAQISPYKDIPALAYERE